MAVEIRGSGTGLTTGDIRLSVNIQGDHHLDPPEDDLRRMVESWLKDMNLPIIEEERNFELQTREFKMKTLQRGVRVVRMAQFARNALELRVCTESHFGYRCYLVCPSARVATEIFKAARPYAFLYIGVDGEAMLQQLEADYLQGGANRQARRKVLRRVEGIDFQTRVLLQDQSLAKLSFLLYESARVREEKNGDSFSGEDIAACLEKLLGIRVNDAMFGHFTVQLVKIGFLEPESPDQRLVREGVVGSKEEFNRLVAGLDVEEGADLLIECVGRDRMSTLRFFPTILFEERLREAKEEEREARIRVLGGQVGKLTNEQLAAERRCEELRAELRRAEERLGGIREELVTTEQEIERLKGNSE